MTFCQSTICSLAVAVGLVAGAIDSADRGRGAVQVISVDTHGNTQIYLRTLRPLIELVHEYSPRARIQVLERTDAGDPSGNLYVLVHHPDLAYLKESNEKAANSPEWAAAIRNLEATGRTMQNSEILLDRTPE